MNVAVWNQVMKRDGEPVLSLSLRRPAPDHHRMARYYGQIEHIWKRRWEAVLYPRACAALDRAREESRPFTPWTATLNFTVVMEREDRVSLYMDATEYGADTRPHIVRMADTWDVKRGLILTLSEVLPHRTGWRKRMLRQIEAQALDRLSSGESLLFEDAASRVYPLFATDRFYCTEDSVHVFYPMLALGAAAEGIPVFTLS